MMPNLSFSFVGLSRPFNDPLCEFVEVHRPAERRPGNHNAGRVVGVVGDLAPLVEAVVGEHAAAEIGDGCVPSISSLEGVAPLCVGAADVESHLAETGCRQSHGGGFLKFAVGLAVLAELDSGRRVVFGDLLAAEHLAVDGGEMAACVLDEDRACLGHGIEVAANQALSAQVDRVESPPDERLARIVYLPSRPRAGDPEWPRSFCIRPRPCRWDRVGRRSPDTCSPTFRRSCCGCGPRRSLV